MKKKDVSRHEPRRDRLIRERVHDPYKTRLKLGEPAVCPQCGAVFHDGRWQWLPQPTLVKTEICQACHRINDKYPAGVVTLSGGFVEHHKTEIVAMIRSLEKEENAEHPLHRVIDIEERVGDMAVTTTDIHLPHRIGHALHDAFEGDLDVHYDEEGYFVRINWHRSA